MKISYLYEGLLFVLLVLLQVLLLSRIALFGIVTPVVYIYFLIKLPIRENSFLRDHIWVSVGNRDRYIL